MFNLLPKEQKRSIYTEYKFRLIILILIFLAVTGIIVAVFLSPSLVLSSFRYNSLVNELQNIEKDTPELENVEGLQETAKKINDKLKIFGSEEELSPLSIWQKIIESKTNGIKITNLSYDRNTDKISVVVSGRSLTRESLTDFSNALEKSGFEDVNLPVSDLARDKNLEFSITLSVILEDEK